MVYRCVPNGVGLILAPLLMLATFMRSVGQVAAQQARPHSGSPTPTPTPRINLASTPYNEEHPLLAYYYGWWEPEKLTWGIHQPERMASPGVRRIINDTALVAEQLRAAQGAGLDGFIANSEYDFEKLLPMLAGSDFRLSLQVSGDYPDSQLRTFYKHIDDPNLVRYRGQPVVFFWQTAAASAADWNMQRDELDPQHNALWIADGDDFSVLQIDAFDGISPYAIAWSANPAGTLASWASRARSNGGGKLFIPPVSPGCDDSPVRTPTCVQDRAAGAYYQRSWAGALALNPAWAVVVSTWNEWMEDTQIEPSVQEGDLYLQLTRQFADRLKGIS